MSDTPEDLVGRVVLGRYRIVRMLGKGGMAAVYLARTEGAAGFMRPVVVKRILTQFVANANMVKLFEREARIMANLRHPGVVGVVDFSEEESGHLLVLEYVHGFDVGQWQNFARRQRGRLSVEISVHVVLSLLDALHYVHTLTGPTGEPLNVIHRDVKPSNILIDLDGRVRLADFGIARMAGDMTDTGPEGGTLKGTLAYLAPELFDSVPPTPQADLYACAVVLRELLVGRNDFRAETPPLTIARVLSYAPSPVSDERDDMPPGLDDALLRALSKTPSERFRTAQDFADALRATRRVSAEEAARQFVTAVTADFVNPEMARELRLDDLASREKAWRTWAPGATGPREVGGDDTTPSGPSAKAAAAAIADADSGIFPPTVAGSSRALSKTPAPTRSSRGLLLGGAALLVAAGGVAFVMLRPHASAPPPQVPVLVERGHVEVDGHEHAQPSPSPAPAPTNPAPIAAAPPQPASAIAPPAAKPTVHHAAKENRLGALTHAFAGQQSRIASCFSDTTTTGAPEIAVRFQLDKAGHVARAELLPPALASTALGECLLRIARATEFGPQPEEVAFRIPITVRPR